MKATPKFVRRTLTATALVVCGVSAIAADLKIGVILPLSGPIASQGIPTSKGIQASAKFKAEVNGRKITFIQLDDASDPSTAARNARKLIDEEKVDVLIGTGGVPGAMAIAAVARESKTPLVSFTPLALQGDDAAWAVTTAQPAPLMIAAIVEHMKKAGIKSVGYIGFSDSWGDLAYSSLQKATEGSAIKVLGNERLTHPSPDRSLNWSLPSPKRFWAALPERLARCRTLRWRNVATKVRFTAPTAFLTTTLCAWQALRHKAYWHPPGRS